MTAGTSPTRFRVPKVAQTQITTAIVAIKRAAQDAEEVAAVAEAPLLPHLAEPDARSCYTTRCQAHVSLTCAACACATPWKAGGFLFHEAKSIGQTREPEEPDCIDERELG